MARDCDFCDANEADPAGCAGCGGQSGGVPDRIIVSRHPAAVEFLREELPDWKNVRLVASATAADVAGSIVAGNVPLHLAALAAEVICVEFRGDAPRGTEYGVAEMRAAGAQLRRYRVESLGTVEK